MKIHGDMGSGNCLKVKYTADFLGLPYTWVPVDIMKGEAQTDAFRAMNPAGQTPVLETADGKYLAQSNAIIRYIARGSSLLPDDAWAQAKIDEWLFWEQYSHEPNVATCRFHMHPKYLGKSRETRDPGKVERGEKALDLLNSRLAGKIFVVGSTLSIADIALLAYTRLAPEGGFDLATRQNMRAWIERCETTLNLQQKGSGS
jgi:glutathione S-transferase